jgi:hypothetical protein
VAGQDDLLQAELRHDSLDVLAKRLDRPLLSLAPRLAVAREVERDHLPVLGQAVHHRVPQVPVARPAVDEHQRGLAVAEGLVPDGHAVGGGDEHVPRT